MHELAEQALAPVRERAAEVSAPLLAKLGVTAEELEPCLTLENRPSRSLMQAAAKVALLGATRF
jgi:hypothetical protein